MKGSLFFTKNLLFLITKQASTYIWVDGGCPKEKLAIGMPTYGRCLELVDINDWGYGAPATGLLGAPQGKYTRENGFLSSYEVNM